MRKRETIGQRILQLRNQRGLNHSQVSKQTGISRAALWEYENEIHTPGGKAIVSLCELFAVTADWLLGIPPVRQR